MAFLNIVMEAEGDEETPKDYTEDDPQGNQDAGDAESSSDYTEEDVNVDPDETGDTPADDDDTDDDGQEENTDYTDEADGAEEGDGTEEDADEPAADDATAEPEDDPLESENNRMLIDDYVRLYRALKNTVIRLTSINNANIIVNKIVGQVTVNLNKLIRVLEDFIMFKFTGNKYTVNLYQYNYFLEAFKVNVMMLKKISILHPES